MAVIKNVSPVGELDVPLLRCRVPAGGEVKVDDDLAAVLLGQPGNWQPVDDDAKKLAPEKPAKKPAAKKHAPAKSDDDTKEAGK